MSSWAFKGGEQPKTNTVLKSGAATTSSNGGDGGNPVSGCRPVGNQQDGRREESQIQTSPQTGAVPVALAVPSTESSNGGDGSSYAPPRQKSNRDQQNMPTSGKTIETDQGKRGDMINQITQSSSMSVPAPADPPAFRPPTQPVVVPSVPQSPQSLMGGTVIGYIVLPNYQRKDWEIQEARLQRKESKSKTEETDPQTTGVGVLQQIRESKPRDQSEVRQPAPARAPMNEAATAGAPTQMGQAPTAAASFPAPNVRLPGPNIPSDQGSATSAPTKRGQEAHTSAPLTASTGSALNSNNQPNKSDDCECCRCF
ncbi:hypothetical protein Dimus_021764 [Dionaea muscipula]